jgi:hypothetical protein
MRKTVWNTRQDRRPTRLTFGVSLKASEMSRLSEIYARLSARADTIEMREHYARLSERYSA